MPRYSPRTRAEVADHLVPRLRRVVFGDVPGAHLSAFQATAGADEGVVRIVPALLPADLAVAVRHALCHAVARRLDAEASSARGADEAFADLCALGPEGVAVLRAGAMACLPPEGRAIVRTLLGEVFLDGAWDPLETVPVEVHDLPWSARDGYHLGQPIGWHTPETAWLVAPADDGDGWTIALLDLDTAGWSEWTNRLYTSPYSRRVSGEDIPLAMRWIDKVYELGDGSRVRLRSTSLPWGGRVSVLATDTSPPVHAGGCLPGNGVVLTWDRALVSHSEPHVLTWFEASDVLDRALGTGWRAWTVR